MKKIIFIVLIFLLSLEIFSQDSQIFKDISKEHWAFKSVENLVYKGVLPIESEIFNGDQEITRYELSYYLSNALNKLDEEKASEDDLSIVEKMVYEFSKELNSFGFDINKYVGKIKDLENNIKSNKISSEKNENALLILQKRLSKLEKTLNKDIESLSMDEDVSIDAEIGTLSLLKNINLNYKSYGSYNKVKNIDTNTEEDIYKSKNIIELIYLNNKFKAKLKYNSESNEDVRIIVKANKKVNKNIELEIYSEENETNITSYYNNLKYINYSFNKDRFNGSGLKVINKYSNFLIEYFDDDLYLINSIDFKYIDSLLVGNLSEKEYEGEIAVKYPIFDNFIISGGYGLIKMDNQKVETEDLRIDINFINTKALYKKDNNIYELGYEKKISNYNLKTEESGFEETKSGTTDLYNNIYAKIKYEIGTKNFLTYRIDILDASLPENSLINHSVLFTNDFKKFKTYLGYNLIKLDKEIFNFDTITDDIASDASNFEKKKSYLELIAKIEYSIKNNLDVRASYRNRDYDEGIVEDIKFIQFKYKLNKSINIYLDYLENRNDFGNSHELNDLEEDINQNKYNLDFDKDTGIIMTNNTRIRLGIELKF